MNFTSFNKPPIVKKTELLSLPENQKEKGETSLESMDELREYFEAIDDIDSHVQEEAKSGRLFKKLANIGIDQIPFVGIVKPAYEAYTGEQYIGKEKLSKEQRVLYLAVAALRAAHWPVLLYGISVAPENAVQGSAMIGAAAGMAQAGTAVYAAAQALGEKGALIKKVSEFRDRVINSINAHLPEWRSLPEDFRNNEHYNYLQLPH